MKHRIKYYYLCDCAFPEDVVFVEDNTNFITLYSKNNLLDINEDILAEWNDKSCGEALI